MASYKDWAEEKVRLLCPNIPEKRTLLAIAHYADPNGENAWPSIASIAKYSLQSERTVQRHIRSLCDQALLVEERGGGYKHTSSFWIPICKMSDAQWEELKGCSKRQMKLPFPRKNGDVVAERGDMVSPKIGDMVSPNHSPSTSLKYRSGDTPKIEGSESEAIDALGSHQSHNSNGFLKEQNFAAEIAPETQALIAETLDRLQQQSRTAPVGVGSRLRAAIYGETASEVGSGAIVEPARS